MSNESTSTSTSNIPQDISDATILTALEVSTAAYAYYVGGQMEDETASGTVTVVDQAWTNLVCSGRSQITGDTLDPQQSVFNDHYQGVAFYKVVDGITEIIIGNRGSSPASAGTAPSKWYDFTTSDFQIAVGTQPACDQDAVNYYNAVVSWAKENLSGSINITEVGHSLGGQEADFVDDVETNNNSMTYSTEAVTFNAPGQPAGVPEVGKTYDALNISINAELVHSGGALLNAGYAGVSDTVQGGVSVAPYQALIGVGRVNSRAVGLGRFRFRGGRPPLH